MEGKILIIGAVGQVGTELTEELRKKYGHENVIASDIRIPENQKDFFQPFETIDVLDKEKLLSIVKKHNVKIIYHLAALLSANAEKNPEFAWKLNIDGLFNVLNLAKEKVINQVFWPSTIAIFGPGTPKINTPQNTFTDPNTVYGISKLAGERWCEYYYEKYNVDVRSIRYPGLIGYKSLPGGGTTDYAVDIFHKAKKEGKYECFLSENASLPMMYMEDAIKATINIMEAPLEKIKVRSSYNIAGMSFSPKELANEIKKHLPDFEITYAPDYRENIAKTWPTSIDDSKAREDWDWKNDYGIKELVDIMLKNV